MLVFKNPGIIALAAVTTMGVSVKTENAFGRFGTGIKYGVARILRGGGSITLYRGTEVHRFSTEAEEVRGRSFDFVCLDGIRIGFTTQLGIDWEPWMVLRELGCNALDEGGEFWEVTDERPMGEFEEETTTIVVEWPDLDTAYRQRGDLFLSGDPLFLNEKIRILPGPSAYLFYRGIRAFKLAKPSLFSYDLIADQLLTEDRTLASVWAADRLIRDTILTIGDSELARQAITTGTEYHENSLNFRADGVAPAPSTEFIRAVTVARESKDKENLSATAREVLSAHTRKQMVEERVERRTVKETGFTEAIGFLYELGMEFADDQSFVTVPDLPGDAKSVLENGTIFLLASLANSDARRIAEELVKRWVDIQPGVYGVDSTVKLLTPHLLDAVPEAKAARLRAEAQAKREAEWEAERAAKREAEELERAQKLEALQAERAAAAEAGPATDAPEF